jgi:hypothetical protein
VNQVDNPLANYFQTLSYKEIIDEMYRCSSAIGQTLHNKLEISNSMSGLEGISG